MTERAGRWNLDVRPRAQRQLARLPEKIATAAAGFLTGSLLENPHRVGHPLQDEYAGQYSARRGPDWRVRYQIDEDARTVIVAGHLPSLRYIRHVSSSPPRPFPGGQFIRVSALISHPRQIDLPRSAPFR